MRVKTVRRRGAFSLLELLIALAIMMIAFIPIAGMLSKMLTNTYDNERHTKSVFLAQQKADEIRRDDNLLGNMVSAIKALTMPTVPVVSPVENRFAYCFTGRSILYHSSTPEGADGIARVLIIDALVTDPAAITRKDVIYEMRFAF